MLMEEGSEVQCCCSQATPSSPWAMLLLPWLPLLLASACLLPRCFIIIHSLPRHVRRPLRPAQARWVVVWCGGKGGVRCVCALE